MSTKVLLKFLASYGVSISMCRDEGIPPVGRGLLPVIALGNVQFLPDGLKPLIGIQGVNRMR
jgi:hypothetical protein